MLKIFLVSSAIVQVLSSNVFKDFQVKSVNGKQLDSNPRIVRPSMILATIQRFRNRTSSTAEEVSTTITEGSVSTLDDIISSINNHGNSLNSFESSQSKILNIVTSNNAQLNDIIEKIIALNDHLANLFNLIQANGNNALKDVVLTNALTTRVETISRGQHEPIDGLNEINITTIKT